MILEPASVGYNPTILKFEMRYNLITTAQIFMDDPGFAGFGKQKVHLQFGSGLKKLSGSVVF